MPFGPGYTKTKTFAAGGSCVPDDLNSIQTDLGNKIADVATLAQAYRTIGLLRSSPATAIATAGTYYFAGSSLVTSGGGSGIPITEILPINLTDFAVAGLSTRFRLLVSYVTNTVGTNITFTFGLYPLGSTGGGSNAMTVTLGTVVSGSTMAVINPSGPGNTAAGSDFTVSSSGVYLPGVVLSGTPTSGSVIHLNVALQVRNV